MSEKIEFINKFQQLVEWGRGVLIQSIGDTAGKVWKFLNEKGEANIIQLMQGVEADAGLILQAIGWLAREDKLRIEKKGLYLIYSLKG